MVLAQVQAMKIKYFKNTDTLYIELSKADIFESRDLDEDTIIDTDIDGDIVTMTIEQASHRTHAPSLTFEEMAAVKTSR